MTAAPPRAGGEPGRLVIATWNIHGCVGRDGRERPERTAAVIQELGADVVALQEVWCHADEAGACTQPALLASLAGYACLLGPTRREAERHFGNALLARPAALRLQRVDLSAPDREPRGALDVTIDAHGTPVRIIATHLGLDLGERRQQVNRLLELIEDEAASEAAPLLVVVGDFNDWLPGRSAAHALDRRLGRCERLRTWPGRWPLLPLDRIWARPREALQSVRVHDSPAARAASDHLPLMATLLVASARAADLARLTISPSPPPPT
jgi:endonuclease/exonuclease/phosphatase family metal-dependent hydrolase